ncbi:transcriptional regulator [Nostoc sp. T09]|uniref:helix-turn-helix domain-containing protein n=1 Tax=Nostoc sp. T09 TaxID=1932621 RepID=UPI000A37DBE8|nr:helix-turn-helix transcriptional regulator [Nostoc sp. T09]OUL23373.1 transcriptional regulator [Nostoc sp. T09]
MGKAGKALKQVLEIYGISQNKLAVTMGTGRSNVHRWVNQIMDPVADAVLEIRDALKKINPAAAEEFIRLYLGDADEDENHQ